MKKKTVLLAVMLCVVMATTACGNKKGDGDNFKGHVADREVFPDETTVEDDLDDDEEIDLFTSTESPHETITTTTEETTTVESTTVESSTTAVQETTEAETTVGTGSDMTNIKLVGIANDNNSYFTIGNYEVSNYTDGIGYTITFDIASKNGSNYNYSVIDASINNQPTNFVSSVSSGVMTVSFIFKDGVSYGDMCSLFSCTISVSSVETGAEIAKVENLSFEADLK